MTALVLLAALMTPAAEDDLPVVVLIGDSIRMGYEPFVTEALRGKARIVGPGKANGGDSANVLRNLDQWAIDHKPAVVHFNAGLHDLKLDRKTGKHQVERADYRKNLAAIRQRLEKETSARLIFATTTPVIDERHRANKGFDRLEADVKAYNEAAREVLGQGGVIAYDDLHAAAEKLGIESALVKDGVHYTPAASRALAESVVAAIERALKTPKATTEADCRWTDQPPTIDGSAEEPIWKQAQVIDRFPAFWKGLDDGDTTRARLLWDEEALYFAAEMTDAELKSFGAKRNDMIWNGDVFELFFKPHGDRPEYYEFQVNPQSVILELAFPERGFDFQELAGRPPMGFRAIAKADGTVNQPGDADRGWSVEGRIPWTIFTAGGGKPKSGDVWSFALCRYDHGPEGTEPLLSSSAPLTRPSFHRYEDYGRVRFVR